MKNIWKTIGKIGKTIFNALAVIVAISLAIAWCVTIVYFSYGAAIWSFQWFMGLI